MEMTNFAAITNHIYIKMLKLNIKKHCRLRNYPDSAAFLRTQGVTSWLSHRLSNEKLNSISFNNLEMLCNLFKCTPNDLFDWTPGNNTGDVSKHPLNALRPQNEPGLQVETLSYSQLKEIAKIVGEKK
jgi:DNA-binding Xre family transcriptional regulator